jgi:hypothetical protein
MLLFIWWRYRGSVLEIHYIGRGHAFECIIPLTQGNKVAVA